MIPRKKKENKLPRGPCSTAPGERKGGKKAKLLGGSEFPSLPSPPPSGCGERELHLQGRLERRSRLCPNARCPPLSSPELAVPPSEQGLPSPEGQTLS